MPLMNFDFVYIPEGETDYRNAHITLDIVQNSTNHSYELYIASEYEISNADIAKITNELEQNNFKKMNIDITKDCKVIVKIL